MKLKLLAPHIVPVGPNNDRWCLSEATIGEVRDTVIQYLVRNPQMRHYPADLLVALALSQAFPCR
jgi:Rap1a immunity proteins